jgi:hypothetical protein
MLEAMVIACCVGRPADVLYDLFWSPEAFPRWASGLSDASLAREGDDWIAEGPEGPVRIRFTPRNAYGVMDHRIELGDGRVVHVPMRIVPNGEGSLVTVTLFRNPWMDDATMARDEAWIRKDLAALKALAESS